METINTTPQNSFTSPEDLDHYVQKKNTIRHYLEEKCQNREAEHDNGLPPNEDQQQFGYLCYRGCCIPFGLPPNKFLELQFNFVYSCYHKNTSRETPSSFLL